MYTIGRLAKLAGVSTRALRFYDEIGLLRPHSLSASGYRMYGEEQVDELQQILFYRALGVGPEEIKRITAQPAYKRLTALEGHLQSLLERRTRMDTLIANVRKTISAERGEAVMTDKEKFEGLKQRLIDDNEKRYGAEARSKFGDAVDKSNAKIMDMDRPQFERMKQLETEVLRALTEAMKTGDPAGDMAQKMCALHKQWLMCTWHTYSKQSHKGLAQAYVDDGRFAAYYEKAGTGAAVFLRDALTVFCQ